MEHKARFELAHAAGLILRSVRILGSSGFVWCENTGTSEWTLHFDPPLDPGGTVEIDCWMPISDSTGMSVPARREPARLAPGRGSFPQSFPSAPSGTAACSARRPGEWTGRLDAATASEPVSDESFVKAWAISLKNRSRSVARGALSASAAPRWRRARHRRGFQSSRP